MKSKFYLIKIFSIVMLLSACAVPSGGYKNTPSSKLCVDYMTLPSANINQSERAAELSRRGENCSGYVGVAQVRQQSDQQMINNLQRIQRGY